MGLILLDRALLSKSLIQFYVDGWGCVYSLLSDLGPNYGGGHEGNGDFLQKVPCTALLHPVPPTLQQATAKPNLRRRLLDTHRQVWVSLLLGHCSFLLGPGAPKFCVCVCVPSKSLFPVLCKFWQLYGGINGSLLQEGLYHTHVCYTQSPCPCSRPLPTYTSTGDAQTQFCLSLCGSLGPGVHKVCLSTLGISGGYPL